MEVTLEILPGEGDVKTVTMIREACEECGEPAHYVPAPEIPKSLDSPSIST